MIEKAKNELEKLLQGNRNFVNGTPTTKNMTLETLQKYAFHQEPYACVLTCSDSRVVPEIIFDCGIGELFVARVAGMTTGPNVVESVEYAVKKLGVPLLILLGHDDCGVMKYAMEHYTKTQKALSVSAQRVKKHYPEPMSNFSSILKCVYPVLDKTEDVTCHNFFAQEHTRWVEDYLMKHSVIINEAVKNDKLLIAKCHFDHLTGLVELI